jgi:lipid-binding SYLF domain-containing protein
MINHILQFKKAIFLFTLIVTILASMQTASANGLTQDARAALNALYTNSPTARALGNKAKGILVFPEITKAALIVGGQGGEGVLFEKGRPVAHYNTGAVSVGMQAGAQS